MNRSSPRFQRIDHIHVFVTDRNTAEGWYAQVLGFTRIGELEFWASEGGPLMLADASDSIHLALFERPPEWTEPSRATIAMAVTADQFLAWRRHLERALGGAIEPVDHQISWSMYFADPDRNPYEITSYEYDEVATGLAGGGEPGPAP